jgi:hypothetical protein
LEKRRSPRVNFKVRAESTLGDSRYKGYIENFSQEGVLKIIPDGNVIHILPGTTLGLRLETPSGEKLTLECEVKWLRHHTNLPFGLNHHVGMEIKDPPQHYKEFVHELYNEYLDE